MILLDELKLHNFISHGESNVKFKKNQKLLIDGKSGAGKSSIAEAILWCFYGKGRSDNRSLIKKGSNFAKVVLFFSDDNIKYKITRLVNNRGKHELQVEKKAKEGYKPIKVSGLRNLQDYIEKDILNSSYLLFINSIIYPQDNTDNFINQPASKRKDILMEIIRAERYDQYYAKTNFTLDKLIKNESDLEIGLQHLKIETKRNNDYIKNKPAMVKKYKAVKEELGNLTLRLDKLKAGVEKAKSKKEMIDKFAELHREAKAKLIGNESRLNFLNNLATKPTIKEDIEQLETIKKNQVAAETWNQNMIDILSAKPADRDFEKELEELNEKYISTIERYKKIPLDEPYHCPKCNHAIDRKEVCIDLKYVEESRKEETAHLEREIERRTEQQKEYVKEIEIFQQKKQALGESPVFDRKKLENLEIQINYKKELATTLNTIRELSNDLKKYDEEIEKANKDLKEVDKLLILKAELDKQRLELEEKLTEVNTNLLFIENLEERQGEIKKVVDKNTKELKTTTVNIEALQHLKQAFGPAGIKAMIVDHIIPQLEHRINSILSVLSNFKVRLDTQRSGITKETVLEGLFINIYNEQGEGFDFNNYSGGERLKIIVAISEALAELQRAGFRILDELFVGLDEESIEGFAEVITSLQKRFQQLICISHLRNIKDMFDEQLYVKKVGGSSTIT